MSDYYDPVLRICRPQTYQNREQKVAGVVTGTVDRIEDDGTYRVRFFGMNPEGNDDDTSAPARVMMPMAGNGRGVHFFPDRGDEDDDTNTPIILGAVWNRDAPAPGQARESPQNHVRTIVTRSGHELTFDDESGKEKITLKSKGGHTIVLDDAPGASKLTIGSHQDARQVILDDTPPGTLSIQTPTCQITMREPGVLSIDAMVSISLSAQTITLDATAIQLTTTGVVTASAVVIDNKPFGTHQHIIGTSVTGVVAP
jgi:uncharacterized protein involved in type VI secretion and phage assembly